MRSFAIQSVLPVDSYPINVEDNGVEAWMSHWLENRVTLMTGAASGIGLLSAGVFTEALKTTAFTNRFGFISDVGLYRFGTSDRSLIIGPGIVELDSSLQK